MQQHVTWSDIEEQVGLLGSAIQRTGFVPDYLIGIATGGLIPLALFAKELGTNKVLMVSVSSYEKDKQGELVVLHLPNADLENKKILLIDEIAETGKTLKAVCDILKTTYKAGEVRTAVIGINSEKCEPKPDFFGIETDKWLVFPWEKKEFPEFFENK